LQYYKDVGSNLTDGITKIEKCQYKVNTNSVYDIFLCQMELEGCRTLTSTRVSMV
jgi:hypothetical protein